MTRLGFQLYSLRPYLETMVGIEKAFKKLAEIGYRDVQISAIPVGIPANDVAHALWRNGLGCVGTQSVFHMDIGDRIDRYIDWTLVCGGRYLTVSLLTGASITQNLEDYVSKLIAAKEKAERAGLIFSWYPVAEDFKRSSGSAPYERVLELMPDDTQLSFSVYNAFKAGTPWQEVLETCRGRVDLVHFKDEIRLDDGSFRQMPLGKGSHDWKSIYEGCERAGVKWVFARQDRWVTDAFDCAAESFSYLRSIGLR